MSVNKVKEYVAQIECFNSPTNDSLLSRSGFNNLSDNNNVSKKLCDINTNSVSLLRENFVKAMDTNSNPLLIKKLIVQSSFNCRSMESLNANNYEFNKDSVPIHISDDNISENVKTSNTLTKNKKTPIPLPRCKLSTKSSISKSSNNINDLCFNIDDSPNIFLQKVSDSQYKSMDIISDVCASSLYDKEPDIEADTCGKFVKKLPSYSTSLVDTSDNEANDTIWFISNEHNFVSSFFKEDQSIIKMASQYIQWSQILDITPFERQIFNKKNFAIFYLFPIYSIKIDEFVLNENRISDNSESDIIFDESTFQELNAHLLKIKNTLEDNLKNSKINEEKILVSIKEKYPVEKYIFKYRGVICDAMQVLHLLIVLTSQIKRASESTAKLSSLENLMLKLEEAEKLKKDIEERQRKLLLHLADALDVEEQVICLIKCSVEPIVYRILQCFIEQRIQNLTLLK